jgi:hypothetical protein
LDRLEEFTVIQAGFKPNKQSTPTESISNIFLLTAMSRPENDQILYMMQMFQASEPATPIRCRLSFCKDTTSVLSYTGIVHSWVTKKNEIADKGECLALPREFFLSSLSGGTLQIKLVSESNTSTK